MSSKIISVVGASRRIAVNYLSAFQFKNIKINDPIIKAAQNIFGFTDEQMQTPNVNVKLHDNTIISPRSAIKFLKIDVFEDNAQYYLPGINGRTFWTRLMINKILAEPNNYVIDDVTRISDYYEIKKYFPDSVFIKINSCDELLHNIQEEYIPHDIELNFTDIQNLHLQLNNVRHILQ
jgi:hypothetical protein